MSEEFQKHMFEQFTQEHEDGRTEYKGTGLGLAIVKRIVEKMGGEIRVNSKKDVGMEFIWTLTFATDKDFVEKVYVQEEGTDSHSDCMKRKKVLIVEDNDMNLEKKSAALTDQMPQQSRSLPCLPMRLRRMWRRQNRQGLQNIW